MYLFKTSGKTFDNVIKYQKHAFDAKPIYHNGELVLVSKNKTDCGRYEKQIQYIMKILGVREINNEKIRGEVGGYWGKENKYRWKWLVDCYEIKKLRKSFNLEDVIGKERAKDYGPVMKFRKVPSDEERTINKFLEKD